MKTRLRNITITLEEELARWARIEAARSDTSVSRLLAEILRERLRSQDLVFRYGGDEFVCVLPDCDLAACRGIFAGIQVAARHKGLSISFGLAEMSPLETRESLLERADAELYRSRRLRRAEEPTRWRKYPTAFPS